MQTGRHLQNHVNFIYYVLTVGLALTEYTQLRVSNPQNNWGLLTDTKLACSFAEKLSINHLHPWGSHCVSRKVEHNEMISVNGLFR